MIEEMQIFWILAFGIGFHILCGLPFIGSGGFLSLYCDFMRNFLKYLTAPTHDDYVARWIAEAYPSGL